MKEKSVLIDKELHAKLKDYSKKTGIKIKALVEISIKSYLRRIVIDGDSN